jgi:hypothetical protein
MPRDLPSLEALLLDREIAVHLATATLNAAVDGSWHLTDDEAFALIDPLADAVMRAERKVEAVKEVIGYLSPSSWATNGGR